MGDPWPHVGRTEVTSPGICSGGWSTTILQIALPPFPILGRDFPPDAAGLPVSASRSDENTDTYWLRFSYLEVLPENLAERLAEFFRVS